MNKIEPVVLSGAGIRLLPMSPDHAPGLARIAFDPSLWKWTPTGVSNMAELEAYMGEALDLQQRGSQLPFVIEDRASGDLIGSTRYGNIERAHKRLEIGWTWLGVKHQRTSANTQAKLLLLTHAFETLGAMRVELKTDVLNEKSRNAILRIGARQEGIFRKHLITATGRIRDSVYFSILDDEWPGVKSRLQDRLASPQLDLGKN